MTFILQGLRSITLQFSTLVFVWIGALLIGLAGLSPIWAAYGEGNYGGGLYNAGDSIISITVADGSIEYGLIPLNSSRSTLSSDLDDQQTVTNDGNATIDINIRGQHSTGSGCSWNIAASPGADQYAHTFCNSTSNSCTSPPTNFNPLDDSDYVELASEIEEDSSVDFHLRLLSPTSVTCHDEQTVNVTLQAVEAV